MMYCTFVFCACACACVCVFNLHLCQGSSKLYSHNAFERLRMLCNQECVMTISVLREVWTTICSYRTRPEKASPLLPALRGLL